MYGNVKTRHRGFSGGRNSGSSRRRPTRNSSVNPQLFVNKAVEVVEEKYQSEHRFSDFALHPQLASAVMNRGYVTPTPIQDKTIPMLLHGKDVIGIANTGTGKTAAFLLPMINKLFSNRNEKLLIIAPTRELAVQIDEEFKAFSTGMRMYSALCIGQMGMNNQIRALSRKPQVVIGTPGRLQDHVNRRTLRLNDVTNLVVDEADRLVDMGFIETTRKLISQLPTERQSLFFSATISSAVERLIGQFTKNAQTISVKNRDTSINVDQDVVRFTDQFHRMTLLHELLIREEFKKVLIFGRTKHGVEKLHVELSDRGFKSVSIHGNKNQNQRQKALQEFKDNQTQIMVATDVAARGLDIPDVTHVINFDAPEQHADYIHRIGRTGRADKKGIALTFVN